MIHLVNVTKRYGPHTALDAVDLDLPGGVTAIMGPNGCGKTTLARILLGLERPDAGAVTGRPVRLAAVFQTDALCPQLTAAANVRLVLPAGAGGVRTALDEIGLDPAAQDRPAAQLSGGERRRVALVRALLPEADLVVLDEPFTGIDPDALGAVRAWVAARLAGRTTLVITHDEADAEALGARLVRWHDSPMTGSGTAGPDVDSKHPWRDQP